MKLKKGDRVVVLQGKDRGKEGVISRVMTKENKVIVDGVNVATRHQKPRRAAEAGGIIQKDMPMPASSVAVISPRDGKATRIGYKVDEAGNKVRICKRTGAEL
jgi:large subunit ribosomal protein L24